MQRERGFILISTLFILAAIALIAAFLAAWTSDTLGQARFRSARAEAERQYMETRDTLLYLLATRPVDSSALQLSSVDPSSLPLPEKLMLDGRAYRFGNIQIGVQDESGLFNLSALLDLYPEDMDALLDALDVKSSERDALIARLQDYADPDDAHRLNGAEKDAYADRGLLPPRNDSLLAPAEVRRVLGFADTGMLDRRGWRWDDLVTTSRVGGVNLNTAPPPVLDILSGRNAQAVNAILRAREKQPLSSASDVSILTGIPFQEDMFRLSFFPSGHFRGRFYSADALLYREFSFSVTSEADAPWRVNYVLSLPADRVHGPDALSPTIPAFDNAARSASR